VEVGAITGYVDLAQILLYVFWLFFAGLIYYLVRENHREGYPMEPDGAGRGPVSGWPIPEPKTYKLEHGEVTIPDPTRREPAYAAVATGSSPGLPIEPTGDPMLSGAGPGAWAERADVPDMTLHGEAKIRPLRAVEGFDVAAGDIDPRGLPVIGADGVQGGTVRDMWVDTAEMLFRYIEVDTGSRSVLLPVPFARIRRTNIEVNSIHGRHFAAVPGTKLPDQVTMLEEEKIAAFYGAGTLYADPKRAEPWL
jgi:photosynthetic reaction center H subunit